MLVEANFCQTQENIPVVTAAAKESDSNTMSAGSSAGTVSKKDNKLPVCPYGASCYRYVCMYALREILSSQTCHVTESSSLVIFIS